MKELIQIFKLIKEIIFKPKETAKSITLVDYNMRTMNILIVLILMVYFFLELHVRLNISCISSLIAEIILIPTISYMITNYGIHFYRKLIISVVKFDIPFDMFKKTVLPYILTTEVFVLILFYFNKISNDYIRILIYQIPFIWYNYQMYSLAKYRIYNKEMNKSESTEIAKKILTILLLLISVTIIRPYMVEHRKIEQNKKQEMLLQELKSQQEQVYNTFLEIFNNVKSIMESGSYLTESEFQRLNNKLKNLYVSNDITPTDYEYRLDGYIKEMIKANRAWYIAKNQNNLQLVKIQLENYYEATEKATYLLKNFLEKNRSLKFESPL